MGVWIRLAKCHAKLLKELRTFEDRPDMTMAQFDMLAQLSRHPDGMTSSDLARALLVTAGNVTGLAERLEARGWVERRPHPNDGRARVLVLSAEGAEVARREIAAHERKIVEVMGALSDSALTRMNRDLERLSASLDEQNT